MHTTIRLQRKTQCRETKYRQNQVGSPFTRNNKNSSLGLNYCSSVGWASSGKLKSHWYDSRSGHMPGLQARSLEGDMQKETD